MKNYKLSLLLVSAIILGSIFYRLWIASLPPLYSCPVVRDDAYYYFGVARHIALGDGVSFDGLHKTNGFHPLWLLLLVPVYMVFPGIEEGYRAALILEALLNGAATLFVYLWLRKIVGTWPAVAAAAAYQMPQLSYLTRTGMEPALAAMLMTASLWYREHMTETGTDREWRIFGVLLGLLVLARLDCLFLVAAFAVIEAWSHKEKRICILCTSMAPAALFGGIFTLWNIINFGHVSPVSVAIKSSFPWPGGGTLKIILNESTIALTLVVIMLWIIFDRMIKRHGWAHYRSTIYALWGAIILHIGNAVLFIRGGELGNWHFVMYAPLLLAAFAIGWQWFFSIAVKLIPQSRNLSEPIIAGVLMVVVIVFNVRETRFFFQLDGWFPREGYRAAQWCNSHLPASARIGMTDCGAMGYFCKLPVVNLDGVINSFEYYSYLKTNRVTEYLRTERINFIAHHRINLDTFPSGTGWKIVRGEPYTMSPFRCYDQEVANLLGKPTEAYHGQPYWDGPFRAVFVIWNIEQLFKNENEHQ